jgi:uncharacterized protein (TIGR03083 family)
MLKTEIQDRVRAAREKLIDSLDGLDEEQASRVGLTSEWSVKDALAHINAWELEGARIVSEIQNGTWQPQRLNKQQIDDFNARAVEERRTRSLDELREEFDAAHTRIEAVIASLPDEVDEKSPAYKYIEGVTFHHLPHHAELIEKYREG